MSSKNKNSSAFIGVVLVLAFLLSWLAIPGEKGTVNGFQIASLTFANGVFDGWADDLAVKFFYSDNSYKKQAAMQAFRNAILTGEKEFPEATAIFNVLGAICSIGGVVAVWLARSAADTKAAFNLGFWAEIVESAVFHAGYYATVGTTTLSSDEVIFTLAVAFFMGFVATQVNKKYHSG